jgi:hypothetical protein
MSTHLNDLPNSLKLKLLLPPQPLNTDGTSTAMDMSDTDGPVVAIQAVANFTGGPLVGNLQHSDDDDTWDNVPDGEFIPVTQGDTVQLLSFQRTRKLLRYQHLQGGTGQATLGVILGTPLKLH